ncbi:MAG TPA: peroxiredoxin [Polyangiaceae bacterium]|nr:peroxiredoxin [Polyangiaceae bacterium]
MATAKKPKKSPAPKSPAKTKKAAPARKVAAKAGPAAQKAAASAGKGSLGVGSRAPGFKLNDQNGKELTSASLAGSPYVLYFYPKDDTTGCTKEACGFRDSFRSFGKLARVIGVSPDSEASHARFAGKYGLPFTLLADPEKKLANAYGVWVKKQNYGREYMGIARSTFVVDDKGVIRNAWRGVRVDGHVEAVLDAVKAL